MTDWVREHLPACVYNNHSISGLRKDGLLHEAALLEKKRETIACSCSYQIIIIERDTTISRTIVIKQYFVIFLFHVRSAWKM